MPIIGREREADIVLPSQTVSARHAFIEALGGSRYLLRDLNSVNGTFVNDQRISECTVTLSDRIRCGSVPLDWRASLRIIEDSSKDQRGWTVGREPGNDLVIPDQRLSARHARVIPEGDQLLIVDLGSSNGVFVNDVQVNRAPISASDRIRFGSMQVGLFPLLHARGLLQESKPAVSAAPDTPRVTESTSAKSVKTERVPRKSLRETLAGLDRRVWYAAAGVLLLAALSIWYEFALRAYDARTESARQSVAAMVAARAGLFNTDGQPADSIDYGKLQNYVALVDAQSGPAKVEIEAIRQGTGMGFWLPTRRATAVHDFTAALEQETALASDSRAALGALADAHASTVSLVQTSTGAREQAAAVLVPDSDVEGFASAATAMRGSEAEFANGAANVRRGLEAQHLEGRPEAIRHSLANGISADLDNETQRIASRVSSLETAHNELSAYKARLNEQLRAESGVVSLIDHFSNALLPALNFAFEKTQPLSQALHEVQQPVPFGSVAGLLGSISGVTPTAEAVSPLSIAANMSPNVRGTVEILQGVCDAIAAAHNELQAASGMITPLSQSIGQFQNSRDRRAMLQVISTAPAAAQYFDSRKNTFDPVIQKIDSARPFVSAIASAAQQAPPFASRILYGVASAGSDLLDAASAPFANANAAMSQLSEGLKQLGAEEDAYRARLTALKDHPEAQQGTMASVEVVAPQTRSAGSR